jgi:hypothetical protein
MPVNIISEMAAPMLPAMRWMAAKEGCWFRSLENLPVVFI